MRIILAQICPKINFGVEILKIKAQIWNQLYLDTTCANFQVKQTSLTSFSANLPKNEFWSHNFKNLRPYSDSATLRYHIFQFSGKTNNFGFFSPNFPKNGLRIGNSENSCRNKNQHPRDIMCTSFPAKWTTLKFLAQICPKKWI